MKRKIYVLFMVMCMAMSSVTGCGKDAGTKADTSYSTSLFDTTYVHKINVEIANEDWEDLKSNPTAKTKYSTKVTIDGNVLENVSFATKGNSSLAQVASSDSDRYSFKLNFGKFVDGQTYQGLDKLNLNNAMSDATYMKDYLSYAIMREAGVDAPLASYVELSINGEVFGLYVAVEEVDESFLARNDKESDTALYKPESEQLDMGDMGGMNFGDMELPEGMDFGNMEWPEGFGSGDMQIPGGFGSGSTSGGKERPSGSDSSSKERPSGFGSGDMELPEGFDPGNMQIPGGFGNGNMGSSFFGGSNGADLVYRDDNVESYADIFDNTVNDVTEEDQKELITAIKTLSTGKKVEKSWDVDAVISYFVAHNFVLNFDSYTGSMLHNYYLMEEDGKVSVVPWDYNLAFGGFGMGMRSGASEGTALVNYPIDTPLSGATEESRPLWNLIASNEDYMETYHEKFSALIENYFESGKCAEEIDRISSMIREYVENDPTAFYSVEEFDTAIETLKTFCNLRAESIRGQLSGTIPSTEEGQSKNSASLIQADDVTISDMGTQGGSKGDRDTDRDDKWDRNF